MLSRREAMDQASSERDDTLDQGRTASESAARECARWIVPILSTPMLQGYDKMVSPGAILRRKRRFAFTTATEGNGKERDPCRCAHIGGTYEFGNELNRRLGSRGLLSSM